MSYFKKTVHTPEGCRYSLDNLFSYRNDRFDVGTVATCSCQRVFTMDERNDKTMIFRDLSGRTVEIKINK